MVSTFGVLIAGRVYRWGCEGLRSTRLSTIEIDKGRISLTFGGMHPSMRIDLPHGLSGQRAVLEICRSLKHETGVTATVFGWDAA